MSGGAIGAVGGIGVGSMGGMGASGQMAMVAQSGMTGRTSAAESVAKPAATAKTAVLEPSAKVVISDAAQALRAGDGVQSGVSIGELAEALIVALLLQLLEHKQSA